MCVKRGGADGAKYKIGQTILLQLPSSHGWAYAVGEVVASETVELSDQEPFIVYGVQTFFQGPGLSEHGGGDVVSVREAEVLLKDFDSGTLLVLRQETYHAKAAS